MIPIYCNLCGEVAGSASREVYRTITSVLCTDCLDKQRMEKQSDKDRVFAGLASAEFWKSVSVARSYCQVLNSIYQLGCLCQQFEAEMLKRLKELEK